jgi:hypothetical protein
VVNYLLAGLGNLSGLPRDSRQCDRAKAKPAGIALPAGICAAEMLLATGVFYCCANFERTCLQ